MNRTCGPIAIAAALALSALLAASPVVMASGAPVGGPTTADTMAAHTLRTLVDSAHNPYLRWPDYPHYRDEMVRLYEPRDFGLLWFEEGRATRPTRHLVEVLLDAEAHGLDSEDYDAEKLAGYLAAVDAGERLDRSELALIDGALSIGFLRYLSDLHIGRVNPANLHFGYNVEQKKLDLAAVALDAVSRDDLPAVVASVEPPFPQYVRMQRVLADYRELAELPLPSVPETATVHPGDPYAGLPQLQELLLALGDLPAGTPRPDSIYEGEIAGGVAHFQLRHGLETDSVIGPATFAHLNTPISDRVEQIELALERLRWLPGVETEPWILVNIPAFELWALDPTHPDHRIAQEMRVVVGKSLNKQTPAFRGDMKYVVMSPYWNVPYSIAVGEVAQRAARDPDYLRTRRFEIVEDFRWESRPLPATDENLAAVRAGRLNVRQKPGPGNALGKAKFIFPNADNVYLHDTPAHALFSRARRDFSHGCIRLERPQDLAEWVLRDQPEWTTESIYAAMNSDAPTRADLVTPLPVILFYTTAMAHQERPHFFDDIYGHDRLLQAALDHGYPYPP